MWMGGAWLLLLVLPRPSHGGGVLRVDSTSSLEVGSSWVLVDLALFESLTNSTFSCAQPSSWITLTLNPSAVAFSRGCWQSIVRVTDSTGSVGSMSDLQAGCKVHGSDESFFLSQDREYSLCGLSYWNTFFGSKGHLSLKVGSTLQLMGLELIVSAMP